MRVADTIHQNLASLPFPSVVGETVSHIKVRQWLQSAVKDAKVEVRIKRDGGKKDRPFMSSGVYYPDTDRAIVYLHFYRNTTHLTLTRRVITRMLFLTAQNAVHELIHRKQRGDTVRPYPIISRRKQSHRRKNMVVYLNDWWEVEAYSYNLAVEMMYHYPTISPSVLCQVPEMYIHLDSYQLYWNTFRGTDWRQLQQSLISNAKIWLTKITSIPPKLPS
jgi:hypothetical protein